MKYILGVYYYKIEWLNLWTKDYAEMLGQVFSEVLSWGRQVNPSKFFFGNITFPITDVFRLTGGARYTSDKKDYESYDASRGATDPTTYKQSHTDYKIGAEYG